MIDAAVVNGISTDGEGNVDELAKSLRHFGLKVGDPVLPRRNATTARMFWRRDIKVLTEYCQSHELKLIAGHSYGGFRILKTAEQHEFDVIVLFAPAIEHDYDLSDVIGNPTIVVIHSHNDRAIWLGSKLWFHFFGEAGRRGLTSPKNPNGLRIGNIPAHGNKHSTYFRKGNLTHWSNITYELFQNRDHRLVRWA